MVSSCKDCLHWNNCLAVFHLSSPHNSMRVHVSLNTASHRKNGPTWYGASVRITTPCARLPLSTACPTKPSDGSFVHLATTERDKPLSSPLPVFEDACVRCDTDALTLITTCSSGVCIEPDTFLSQVYTFQTCLSRSFPCFLLMQGLLDRPPMSGRRYRNSVTEEGGRNTGRTWTQDGQRRQAEPSVGLHRLYSCPPGRSPVVSHP